MKWNAQEISKFRYLREFSLARLGKAERARRQASEAERARFEEMMFADLSRSAYGIANHIFW